MIGKYQLETSEGFDAYMSELGVNWFTRKIACALYPTATNIQNPDGSITINTSSTFRPGVKFQEDTVDGRTVTTTATIQGNTIVKYQQGKEGEPTRIETREFSPDGSHMTLIHTMPGKKNIRSVRGYNRCNGNC